MNDDDSRDAHLLAALRHAPDRDLAPPEQLSAAILGQARQAVRAQQRPQPSRWQALWARLWQPAPMAAFGALAMATLIGVMWQGQEVPEAAPSLRPEGVATAPGPAPAAPEAVRAEPAVPIVPSLSREALPSTGSGQSEIQAQGERALKAEVPAQKTTPPLAQRRAPTAAPITRPAPGSPTVPSPSNEGPIATDSSGLGQTRPERIAENAPRAKKAAPPAAIQEREDRRDALAKSSMADAAAAPSPVAAPALAQPPTAPAAAAPAGARARNEMPAMALGAAQPTTAAPLAAASGEIDAASSVRWRVAPDRLLAHGTAQRSWWSALDRATQGRWQLVATALAAPADGASLVLLIDDRPRGSLSFAPQAVLWRDANGLIWRAAVAADTLREWQEAIAGW
jgi:hypothetical protein